MGRSSRRWAGWGLVVVLWGLGVGVGCDALKERISPVEDREEKEEKGEEESESDGETKKKSKKSDDDEDDDKKSKSDDEDNDDDEDEDEDNDEDEDDGKKKEKSKKSDDDKGAAKADFFEDAGPVFAAFEEELGQDVQALQLTIYPGYAFIEAQDAKKKQNVDRFQFRDGKLGEPEPVRLAGRQKDDLDEHLFPLREVDAKALPKVAKDALDRAKLEDGKVTHMIVQRRLPFDKAVRCLVYMNGPRGSAFAEYDAKGAFVKLHD